MSDSSVKSLTRDLAPVGLRMQPDLKARVQAAAEANNRSMNAEIVAVLEREYPEPRGTNDLLGEYYALSMRLIKDDVPPSERVEVKSILETLYQELLRRRDLEYPDGPR